MDQAPKPEAPASSLFLVCKLEPGIGCGLGPLTPLPKTHCVFVCWAALEKKMAGRQGREELIKKGLLEMMEQGKWDPPLAWKGTVLGMRNEKSHMNPGSPSETE